MVFIKGRFFRQKIGCQEEVHQRDNLCNWLLNIFFAFECVYVSFLLLRTFVYICLIDLITTVELYMYDDEAFQFTAVCHSYICVYNTKTR